MGYIIRMMNDELMDMIRVSCDECITAADEAEMEYARMVHESEERERVEAGARLEAQYGPLLTRSERARHDHDYSDYIGMAWKD